VIGWIDEFEVILEELLCWLDGFVEGGELVQATRRIPKSRIDTPIEMGFVAFIPIDLWIDSSIM
jgi:hypothetical protein